MTDKIETASVLAFERKLDPSDALLFAGTWAARDASTDWQPVAVREKSVRGTISNRLKDTSKEHKDPAKLDASIQNPNPQTVDVSTLPADADTLKVQFTLRVFGSVGVPSACNNEGYGSKLIQTLQTYRQANGGFDELAGRYALNLANGRFLWRNRIGAEQVEVHVAQLKDGKPSLSWTFDALAFSLRDMTAPTDQAHAISELAKVIASGLESSIEKPVHVLLQVTAFVRIGAGQEVFPSQELILDRGRGDKSKTLYKMGEGKDAIAAIHSQKIGNAIRTIDTWYPGADENGPIAVEPYGSVTTQGKAWRQPKAKKDFYTLLDGWIVDDKVPEPEQQHFVIATLIRGGVFGKADG